MNMREKIQKILDKAKSTDSEAEAEMLYAKAHDLMERHQIEAFELGDNSDPIGMTVGLAGQSGPSAYKPMVQGALARYYGATIIRMFSTKDKFRNELVGPESARITTELMTEYCWDQIKEQAKRLAEQGHGKRDSLVRKIANAFTARVNLLTIEQRKSDKPKTVAAQKNALVVKDATEAWVADNYRGLQTKAAAKRKTTSAAASAASGISLSRQMGGATTLRIGG